MDKQNEGVINQLNFNTAYSANLKNDASYKIYQQWLQQNGAIISPKIIYPAYFGDDGKGIIGIGVSQSISAHQAIIAIPYKLIITSQKARKDLRISKIIQENPNIFGLESGSQFINIAIFLCCQLALKDKSFYGPYLNICMKNHIQKWSHWDMLAVENNEVTKQMKLQSERIEQLTKQLITIFAKYPSIFPDSISSQQYSQIIWKAYYMITTRSFGWPLPSRSLIPFADALNHSNKGYITHQLISISEKSAQTNTSNKINLTILNKCEDQSKQKGSIKESKIRRFVEKHSQLKSEDKQVGFYEILRSQYMKGQRNLRQLHFYEDSCEEDNDTDQQLIDKFEQEVTLFRKYENRSNGIDNKNKKQYLIKYWRIYLDPIFKQHYADKQKSGGVDESEQPQQSEQSEQQNEKIKQEEENEKQERESQKSISSYLSSTSSSEDDAVSAVNAIDQQHTYFVVATRKYQNKNDQLYNFYGRRSNKFLLVGYSFILDNNKYDSFAFRIYVDNWKINSRPFERIISPANLIAKTGRPTSMYTQQVRLKMNKINIQLINHCRALLIGWNNPKQINSLVEEKKRKIKIMTPFCRQFEKDVLELGRQFIRRLELQYLTSLEQDEQLLTKIQKQSSKSAIKLRIIHKKILRNQKKLLSMCEGCLQIWKDGRIQVKNCQQMEEICKIKQYLISLQRSKI